MIKHNAPVILYTRAGNKVILVHWMLISYSLQYHGILSVLYFSTLMIAVLSSVMNSVSGYLHKIKVNSLHAYDLCPWTSDILNAEYAGKKNKHALGTNWQNIWSKVLRFATWIGVMYDTSGIYQYTIALLFGCSRSIVMRHWTADQWVKRSILHLGRGLTKNHFLSSGYLQSSITLQCRILAFNIIHSFAWLFWVF